MKDQVQRATSSNSAFVSARYGLVFFFLMLFLAAMVLGPLLYWGLAFAHVPFHRAMDRALLISAVGALFLFRSRIPLAKLWPLHRVAWWQLFFGYILAAVSAQAIIGFNLAGIGFTRVHLSWQEMALRILTALIAALLIPPLEETIFRGFIQSELVRGMGWCWGWIVAALIFMLAHFVKIPVDLDQQPVHFWSGVSAVGKAFLPVIDHEFLSRKGLNLFLLGLVLGGLFLRSGSLWINAGLHSGLVFALLLFTGLTRPYDHPNGEWVGADILSSLLTSVVLILLGLWLWRFYQPHSIGPEAGESVR